MFPEPVENSCGIRAVDNLGDQTRLKIIAPRSRDSLDGNGMETHTGQFAIITEGAKPITLSHTSRALLGEFTDRT